MKIIKDLFASHSLKTEFAARRDKLYRIAFSWCHDAALADDLVQETIYKAIKGASGLRDVNTLDSWIYRILYNCWQDYLRVKDRNVEFTEMHDINEVDHSEKYQQSQIVRRVRASVEQLPLPLREVATGIDNISASLTISSPADDAVAPPPATITGLFAFSRSFTASRTDAVSGKGRCEGYFENIVSTFTVAVNSVPISIHSG